MNDKKAMKLALEALEIMYIHYTQNRHVNEGITALREALAQPVQPTEPAQTFYQPAANEAVEILKSLGYVYEPTYTGLAWVAKKSAQPVQEPVAWTTMPEADDWDFVSGNKDPTGKLEGKWFPLYTAPPAAQRKPLTDDVLVPLEVLEAAANSLDSFCGNLGWGDEDLQNMDNLFAVIEQHKAAHGIKENT